jgi:hypothetical protein
LLKSKQKGGEERPLKTRDLRNGYNNAIVARAFNKYPFQQRKGYIVRPQF